MSARTALAVLLVGLALSSSSDVRASGGVRASSGQEPVPRSGGARTPLAAQTTCVTSIRDQAQPDVCVEVSSQPVFGKLLPYPGRFNSFAPPAVVVGGYFNVAQDDWSTVVGGKTNRANSNFATVAGGGSNSANADFSTIVGGGQNNTFDVFGTVAGGFFNSAVGEAAAVLGGEYNRAIGRGATVGGGGGANYQGYLGNMALGNRSTVTGGTENEARGMSSAITGGRDNVALGTASSIVGGRGNGAAGTYAAVGGGRDNQATGPSAAVAGGRDNEAAGSYSFAAGRRAKANHAGAFVWGDSAAADKTSSASDEFTVYASGGVRLFTDGAATVGAALGPGSGTWSSLSDRDSKKRVEPVDAREVLARVAELPISTWSYRTQDESIRHMGPMAQDFRAAFGLGACETMIDSVDPDGVAFAAIQGLNARLDEKDEEIAALRAELDALREELMR